MKKFDLNIEKILENWEIYHAIREIIANALDEQILTKTQEVRIYKHESYWIIRDFGRGIKYTNLTQNENDEKLSNPNVIGKFGIGLKDAMATFDRHGIKILLRSKYGDISLTKTHKEDFSDIITLHAVVMESSAPEMVGTEVIMQNIEDIQIEKAKNLFLKFTGEQIIESTEYGDVIMKNQNSGNIYINGVKVSEEENFLFSYNITKLNTVIKKALNRERSNVGRTAYTDRIKNILLNSTSLKVAEILANDLKNISFGTYHDELNWIDVQEHSTKILNQSGKVLFASSYDIMTNPNMIDEAKNSGYNVITIPENLKERIRGNTDLGGAPIVDLTEFVNNFNESFEFEYVEYQNLQDWEKEIYNFTDKIIQISGGKPNNVQNIRISQTMRKDIFNDGCVGIYDYSTGEIVIHRAQLTSLRGYAGTLIHELTHARTGLSDVTREFESELTEMIGLLSEKILR